MPRCLLACGLFTSAALSGPLAPPALPAPLRSGLGKYRAYRHLWMHPDGRVLAADMGRGVTAFIDRHSGERVLAAVSEACKGNNFLGFTADGRGFVTGRPGKSDPDTSRVLAWDAKTWDLETGKPLVTIKLRYGQGMTPHMYLVARGVLVALSSTKGPASAYDLSTGKEIRSFKGSEDARPSRTSLSADGNWLAAVTGGRKVLVWPVRKEGGPREFLADAGRSGNVALSADGRYLAHESEGRCTVYDREKEEVLARTDLRMRDCAEGLVFTPDGRTVVGAGAGLNYGLAVWDWRTQVEPRGGSPKGRTQFLEEFLAKRDERGAQYNPRVSADGRWVLASLRDVGSLWDLRPVRLLRMPREITPEPPKRP